MGCVSHMVGKVGCSAWDGSDLEDKVKHDNCIQILHKCLPDSPQQ